MAFEDPHDKGLFCSDNGTLATKITFTTGVSILWQTDLYPDAANPTHLRFAALPLESGSMPPWPRMNVDACVPVNSDRTLTLALDDDPTTDIIRIDLDQLPSCSEAVVPIPTVTTWSILVLILLMTAVGMAGLRPLLRTSDNRLFPR